MGINVIYFSTFKTSPTAFEQHDGNYDNSGANYLFNDRPNPITHSQLLVFTLTEIVYRNTLHKVLFNLKE